MLIGEAPGIEEEKSGLTFMSQAGELLNKMLTAINIKKENNNRKNNRVDAKNINPFKILSL